MPFTTLDDDGEFIEFATFEQVARFHGEQIPRMRQRAIAAGLKENLETGADFPAWYAALIYPGRKENG